MLLGTAAASGEGYAVLVGADEPERGFIEGVGAIGRLSNQGRPVGESGELIVEFLTNSGGPSLRLELGSSGVPNDDTTFIDLEISNGPLAGTYQRTDGAYSTGGGQTSWTWTVATVFIVDEVYAFFFT